MITWNYLPYFDIRDTGGTAADSDKGAGVVALTMFDFRRRGKVDRLGMCGVNVSTGTS